ncbi:protocadherin-18a [Sardina pilchardus]|uniref:protocadherin-18a n=1 Tax=Sardina pilchardus TaxID=27697 RepID=UPI002E1247F0
MDINRNGAFIFIRTLKLLVTMILVQHVTGKTLKYQVYEEQRIGTVIARLKEDVADVLSKLPSSVSLRFKAMQRGSTLLSVREQDGEISIRSKIDREKLCEKNVNCSIEFDVLTLPTEHLQLFHVEIQILDINDNAPQFSRSVIPIEISESAAVGARIPLDSATDPDVGDNSLHTYSLTPATDFFMIDILTRTDGAKYAELVVLRELDRETRSSYELQLIASDKGVPPKSGSTLLKINIADSNDNNPVFEKPSYVINLLENSPIGSMIIDLNATDPDEGTNGKIVYSFSTHVSTKIQETFKINSDNGQLTLIRKVDYETTNSYDIDIQAQDLGPNSMPAHCKVIIKVIDVNDNKPEISINLMSPGNEEVAYISEGAAVDTFVALVRVDDKDTGLNGEVICRLHGQGHFRLQKSYEKNYMILTDVALDREKRSEYSLTVVAEDRGSPSQSTIKHFTVQVLDENDNAPQFEKSLYEVFKPENNPPGAYLTSVVAVDPDQGLNGQVSYSIVESAVEGSSISTYVTVDPSNGAIYTLRSFDREDVSRVVFTLLAQDAGSPRLSGNVTVVLTLLDENDNPPFIVAPQLWNHTADVPVSRYTPAGQVLTAIRATDKDAGANGELSCVIAAGNEAGYFAMDARTCEIRANVSVEQIPADRVEVTCLVRDNGPEPLSARAVLKFTIYENLDSAIHTHTADGAGGKEPLDVSRFIIISLAIVCVLLLVIMVAFAVHCGREKKDTHSYNCRVAESTYQHHPKKPSRQIHKGDITLVPTVNGTLPIRAHHHSPAGSPLAERAQMSSRQSHHSRQSLNSLVTISSNHIPESFALELAHATPPVEQVSQLLSLLHQGHYQPRPSFRGNKYSRNYRYGLQDMDKFSLKDSGRGDSDAGDSDCDMGRESPIDRLLGEGFSDLFHMDAHQRLHPATRLCTEECRILGHSDQCWMPSVPSPASTSSDYRTNMFIPGEEASPQALVEEDQQSVDSSKKSFSTFGKESEEECGVGGGSLLSEMNSVFQRLLPPSLDTYGECNEMAERSVALETRRGLLPGKSSSSSSSSMYPQGVAAWAANTHFQNPSNTSGNHIATPTHGPANHATATTQTHLKWLPAMEEIPENYEEDELDSVLGHLQGKRSDSRHEVTMDAGELAAEINKLLIDVHRN